ncbi:energy transducer TonB [Spirosoma pollinicola]|uniref:Energy transducer TonB n=1 Tax=Spirosoma pollinicola TaxID=2057025 RepID=A0A2K8YY65_9BACT|nr:energy transducer TonB [Spirosoma pollinicola]AUD02524.1 energy transducer TonB [Spirosoma pollinicola]
MQLRFQLSISALIQFLVMSAGLFFIPSVGLAQTVAKVDTTVFTIVEKQPEFPGGMSALSTYMKANVNYPPEAQKAGMKGRVFVSFIVETDGSRTAITLLKELGYGCDEEAMRVIRLMPAWQPGSQSGRPLRVKYNLPVLFGIDYPKVKVR